MTRAVGVFLLVLFAPGLASAGGRVSADGVCGGLLGLVCAEGQYCKYGENAHCGAGDQQGQCEPRPQICTKEYRPVCGCDGMTYANACEAASNGYAVASEGPCD